jgi:hypothetical protein
MGDRTRKAEKRLFVFGKKRNKQPSSDFLFHLEDFLS